MKTSFGQSGVEFSKRMLTNTVKLRDLLFGKAVEIVQRFDTSTLQGPFSRCAKSFREITLIHAGSAIARVVRNGKHDTSPQCLHKNRAMLPNPLAQ